MPCRALAVALLLSVADGWLMSYPAGPGTDTILGHTDRGKESSTDTGGVGGSAGSFGADFPQAGTPPVATGSFASMIGLPVPDAEAMALPGTRPLAMRTTPPGVYRDSTSRSLVQAPPEPETACAPEDQPPADQCVYPRVPFTDAPHGVGVAVASAACRSQSRRQASGCPGKRPPDDIRDGQAHDPHTHIGCTCVSIGLFCYDEHSHLCANQHM